MKNTQTENIHYRQPVDTVLAKLDTGEAGLSEAEAKTRLDKYGLNTIKSSRKISPLKIFIDQFKDVLIVVLIIAASISMGLSLYETGHAGEESLLIYGIVIAIALVGFFNEYKAEKTVDSLKSMLAFHAKVIRSGKTLEVDAESLVPGDIILLDEGQKVPADARLLNSEELRINESSLTGESETVSKKADDINKSVALADRINMVYSGTHVASGTGKAVVVATGLATEIGAIASLVDSVEQEATPMQKKLDQLGKKLGLVVIVLCALVFIIVFASNTEDSPGLASRLIFSFTAAVALAVAAIPEGLAFVVRISLALGASRMAKQNALVRRLSSVEALGSTDVICSDKTGTLTKGEMTVRRLWCDGKTYGLSGEGYQTSGELMDDSGNSTKPAVQVKEMLLAGALCNNAVLKDDQIIGDPTEGSLLVSAAKIGLSSTEFNRFRRVKEFPFTSDRKMMGVVVRGDDTQTIYVKGAPDVVLEKCKFVVVNGKKVKLTDGYKKQILATNHQFAGQALRVLGFASRELSSEGYDSADKTEKDLTFLGLQAMMDPPRPEVAKVIERVQAEAGMRVVMITGDHIDTAKAIATELNITGSGITGLELDELSDEQFEAQVEQTNIYARVSPEHKIRIVQALKAKGHQVAMTGDGVNDAPAIKAADIGIAMGITGTDVTKEAADLILLDDKFTTIIKAIEEGRGIFDNVRKFVNFLLSANIAEVVTIVAGIIFTGKLLLSPSQILFINIVTDGLPAVALGSDPAARNVMKALPAKFQSAIINTRTWIEIIIFAFIMTTALIILNMTVSPIYASTVVFTGMVIFEMARLIDIRTDYKIKWLSNPLLTVSIIASLMIQIAVLSVPSLARLFDARSLSMGYWALILVVAAILVLIMKLLNKPLDRIAKEHV